MIFKTLGLVLVVISCAVFGNILAKKDENRRNALFEMKQTLNLLRSEMLYASNPLPGAVCHVAARTKRYSNFYTDLYERQNSGSGESFQEIWFGSLELLRSTGLSAEDIRTIGDCGSSLGSFDAERQAYSIQTAIDYIDETNGGLLAVIEKNGKLYRSLGLLGGILIAVLLI